MKIAKSGNGTEERYLVTEHEQTIHLTRSKGVCPQCGLSLFPLDEELGLLSGRYTPRLQEAMARLGGQLPFREAVEELGHSYHPAISEPTCRRVTQRSGQAAEAVVHSFVEREVRK